MTTSRSIPRRIGFWLSRLILGMVLIVSASLVAVFSFEQSTLRPLAEFLVERATGRAFLIEGDLDASAGRVVSLRAHRISLANADWGSSATLMSIDMAEVSIDLSRLLDGVLAIDDVVVSGVKLLVEQNAQGQSNWVMASGEDPTMSETENGSLMDLDDNGLETSSTMVLPIIQSQLSDIDITINNPALPNPLSIHFDSLGHSAEQGNELRLTAVGAVEDQPLKLQASIGPIAQLMDLAAVDFDIDANFETIALQARGHLDQLLAPQQATLQISLAAPEISRVFETLGLPALVSGAAELKGNLLPSGDHHELDLVASVDSLELDAKARLQQLDSIDGASVSIATGGPDLAAVAMLAGLEGLPSQPFKFESSAALSGQLLTIHDARFDTGNSHLIAKGTMSQFPKLDGTNLKLQMNGDNYLDFAELLGSQDIGKFEPEAFEARADFIHKDSGQQQITAQLAIADISGNFDATLTGNPEYVGSHLDFRLTGQNDALIQQLLRRPVLVAGAYALQGKVTRTETGFDIEPVNVSVGANELRLSGKIGNVALQDDTELSVHFQGPDIDKLVTSAGYSGFLPSGTAEIKADLKTEDKLIHLDELSAQLGRSSLKASGTISLQDGLNGSRVEVALAGADIVDLLPPDLHGYVDPQQSFELAGALETKTDRLAINNLQAKLGALQLKASGNVSTRQPLTDTALKVNLQGPDLAAVIPEDLLTFSMPAEKFSVIGDIAFTTKGLKLDGVKTLIGEDKADISGLIPLDTPTEGLELTITASGPNLGEVLPLDPEQIDFADRPYDITGNIQIAKGTVSLRKLKFAVPPNQLSGEMSVSLENPLHLGQFDLKAKGNNLAEIVPATPRYTPPTVAFNFDARGSWDSELVKIDRGVLQLDDSKVELQGEVDLPPNLTATRLDFSVRGDNLADFGQFEGVNLPQEDFHIDATLQGDSEGLEIPGFDARIGDSDLQGALRVVFTEKPDIKIKLESELFDLAKLLPPEDASAEVETAAQPQPSDGRVIPLLPVPAEQLNQINLETRIIMAELRLPHNTLHNIEFDSTLRDGILSVNQLKATATRGQIIARFRAAAEGENIATSGRLEGRDIVLGERQADGGESTSPEMNFELEFDTAGATTRDLAANLNGHVHLQGGKGRLKNSLALGLFGSFFTELFSAVNPFATREPYTSISCFGAYAEINDGVLEINPAAVLRTDKLDMFSIGRVNLNTERIGLRFETHARSGLGISLGNFVNPFVGVSGTLAKPGLGLDPENAMFKGGFAIATGGLSIVAKSLFDRWLDNADPCVRLEQKSQQLLDKKQQAEQQEPAADTQ